MVERLAMLWLVISVIPYFITFMILYAGQRGSGRGSQHFTASRDEESDREQPVLSVIIPVRNESGNIAGITNYLKKQDYPRHLTEIIIVDDNSTDNSYDIAVESLDGIPGCQVTRNGGIGKKEAILTGIGLSSGRYIVTTDADCQLPDGWLTSISLTVRRENPGMIIGPVYPVENKGLLNRFMQLEFLSVQSVTEASAKLGHPVMAGGANLVFSRELSEGYKDFILPSLKSGDDMFLLHQAKKKKYKIVFNSNRDGEVRTPMPRTAREFFIQRLRWSGKSLKYNDPDTIAVGIITAYTSLFITALLVASLFTGGLTPVILYIYLAKSIPDLLLLLDLTTRVKRRVLLSLFLPLQVVYPVYVTFTLIASLIHIPGWKE